MKAFALPLLSIQQKVTLSPMQSDHGPQTDLVRQSHDKICIFYVPITSELCFNISIFFLQQIVSSPSFTPGNMVLLTFRTGITFSVGGIRLSLPSSYQLLSASLNVLNYGRAAESATALILEGSVVRIAVVNVCHGNNELGVVMRHLWFLASFETTSNAFLFWGGGWRFHWKDIGKMSGVILSCWAAEEKTWDAQHSFTLMLSSTF